MNIAKMNAQIVAQASGFKAGMKDASKDVTSFASSFSSASSTLKTAAGIASAAMAAYGLSSFVSNSIEAIDTLDDTATSLGITTDALSRMQYATSFAGVSSESLTSSLGKMLQNLDKASTDGGAAAAALADMGLNADELKRMSPDEAFAKIADGMASIQNPSDRATAAVKIFGKSGMELIPALKGGADGLRAMYEESDRFGNTVKATDASQVAAAADAMQRVGTVITGIGRQLAIGLAPYITAVADKFTETATAGGGIGPIITDAIEMVATSISYAAGTIDVFKAGWYTLKGTVLGVVAGILYAIDGIGRGLAEVINLIPGVEVSFDGLGAYADSFAEDAKQAFSDAGDAITSVANGDRQEAVKSFFDEVRAGAESAATGADKSALAINRIGDAADEANKKVSDGIAKLKQQVEEFGMSDADKLASSMKRDGASDADIAQAVAYQKELDALNEKKKAQDDARKSAEDYYKSTRTDAEKYAEEIDRINKLQADGLLDADTAQRAKDAAQKTLDESQKRSGGGASSSEQPEGPKLLQSGSQEAAKFVADIQRRGDGPDRAMETIKLHRQGNKYLAKLASKDTSSTTSEAQVVNF